MNVMIILSILVIYIHIYVVYIIHVYIIVVSWLFFSLAIIQWPSLSLLILVWCLLCEITTPPYFRILLVWNIIFHLFTFSMGVSLSISPWLFLVRKKQLGLIFTANFWPIWRLFFCSHHIHLRDCMHILIYFIVVCLLGAHTCYSTCVERSEDRHLSGVNFLFLPLRPQGWNSVL